MKIQSQKDFYSGLMFTIVGGSFALGASDYAVGTGARMGPGYFPLVLGVLLAILGVAITFTSMVVETEDGDKIGRF
ncbi:tripartite tricarboxylate transporter TctB family protein, partial [Rhodoferax sp.]|uniref:tripartite tricarboxylate transporter TctB family protein n=1 Tax=Rhodoferax sp. TaxID=50421 RepID=UPI0025E5F16B